MRRCIWQLLDNLFPGIDDDSTLTFRCVSPPWWVPHWLAWHLCWSALFGGLFHWWWWVVQLSFSIWWLGGWVCWGWWFFADGDIRLDLWMVESDEDDKPSSSHISFSWPGHNLGFFIFVILPGLLKSESFVLLVQFSSGLGTLSASLWSLPHSCVGLPVLGELISLSPQDSSDPANLHWQVL